MSRPKPNLTEEQFKARQARWVQNWRTNNPEKAKLARKRAYNNRKIKAIKKVGEAKCRNCGCDELSFLEFNHINGNGCKEWRQNKGMGTAEQILMLGRKTDDLEILCRVCNALDYLERKNKGLASHFRVTWTKEV